jgi:hypothetical protein
MRIRVFMVSSLIAAVPAAAQTAASSITFYELPAFLGRSETVTAETKGLPASSIARRAQSARVIGAWTVCPTENFAGTCTTLTADVPSLALVGLNKKIVSLRPTAADTSASTGSASGAPTAPTTAAAVNLAELDADAGVEGQDTAFFARPAFGTVQVAAGTNDRTAADAFCRQAGYTSSLYAGRARAQASGIIDLAASAKVRGFPLRDVLCRK